MSSDSLAACLRRAAIPERSALIVSYSFDQSFIWEQFEQVMEQFKELVDELRMPGIWVLGSRGCYPGESPRISFLAVELKEGIIDTLADEQRREAEMASNRDAGDDDLDIPMFLRADTPASGEPGGQ